MKMKNMTLAGIILLVLAFTIGMAGATEQNATGSGIPAATVTGTSTVILTAATAPIAGAEDDEEVDEGLIGPGNALYGLKIAFENIGETFTFNASEKLGLQVAHARHRIAEARAALKRNDTEAADRALDEYRAKLNKINDSVSKLSDKDTGVANAQKMILKHQLILEKLSISHPDNMGLQRAYNNSKNLETKFASKIERKFDINITEGNRTAQKNEEIGASAKEEKSENGAKRGERS